MMRAQQLRCGSNYLRFEAMLAPSKTLIRGKYNQRVFILATILERLDYSANTFVNG